MSREGPSTGHGVSGADDGAEPGEDHRLPVRRGAALAPRARTRRGGGAGGEVARPRRVAAAALLARPISRSEVHTYELQSLMRTSYAVFCLKKKIPSNQSTTETTSIRYIS